jgi:hypothetical protein
MHQSVRPYSVSLILKWNLDRRWIQNKVQDFPNLVMMRYIEQKIGLMMVQMKKCSFEPSCSTLYLFVCSLSIKNSMLTTKTPKNGPAKVLNI